MYAIQFEKFDRGVLMLNDRQTGALRALIEDVNAPVHASTRKVLEGRGLVDDNGVTLSGYHQLDITRHHPEMPVPSAEAWAHLKGKSVEVTEIPMDEIAEIYGVGETFRLDIEAIMTRYEKYAQLVNEEIKKIWSTDVDREYAHCLAHNHVAYLNPKWAMQSARSKVDSDIMGYYTGDISCQIAEQLLKGTMHAEIGGHSLKYSYGDTDHEVEVIKAAPDAEVAAAYEYEVWR